VRRESRQKNGYKNHVTGKLYYVVTRSVLSRKLYYVVTKSVLGQEDCPILIRSILVVLPINVRS